MTPHKNIGVEAESVSTPVRLADRLTWLGGVLATLLILIVFAIVVYAVFQRYVIDRSLMWADEMTGYLLVTLIMLGCAEALRKGDHIAIDLASSFAGPRLASTLHVIGNLAVIVFALIMGWSAWHSISFARAFGSYSVGYIEIQTWIPMLPMMLGAALLLIAALARLARSIAGEHQ